MKSRLIILPSRDFDTQQGLTLIEVVGVLAVMCVFATLVLPVLTKQVDKAVSDQESATLRSFGDAYQRVVLRKGYIPGPTGSDWVTNIAAEVGLDTSEVVTNTRHNARYFIVDPSFWSAGNSALPYAQTVNGTNRPVSPRVMLLSSLGVSIPTTPAPTDFSNLWNTADGSVPANLAALGWPKGEDLKIGRIDLSPLFIHLVLASTSSTSNAYYSINGNLNPNYLTQGSGWLDAYFLQNSVLGLYADPQTNLDSRQILIHDSSFSFYVNSWRGRPSGNGNGDGPTFVGGFDVSLVVDAFLGGAPNPPQAQVLAGFSSYLSNYNQWAGLGFQAGAGSDTVRYAFMTMMTNFLLLP